jgi:hypothetical protein
VDSKDVVDGYIKLYERQMAHYEKSQEIEWRGSFGIWTLLGAAIYWATTTTTVLPLGRWGSVILLLAPLLHGLWLYKMHQSEEFDKRLWARYRKAAREILLKETSAANASLPADEGEYVGLTFRQRMWWIVLELAITFALTTVLVIVVVQQAS